MVLPISRQAIKISINVLDKSRANQWAKSLCILSKHLINMADEDGECSKWLRWVVAEVVVVVAVAWTVGLQPR
ncbi:MAG: hypothetical protein LBU60_01705 [Clostridiales bacterium]|nr:hypothetical protein [Clostridiales bacterium]